jgi:abhydrolase domain-containing protein 13
MMKRVIIGTAITAGMVAVSSALLYSVQDSLIYLPNHPSIELKSPDRNPTGYKNPLEREIPYEDHTITTKDGLKLHAWFMQQKDLDAPTVLFFHANAGNMGMRMDNLEQLYKIVKVNVFILSYRGYGNSEGSPSEKGLMIDAEAAIEYLYKLNIDKTKVFVFGRSLGGAVAIFATWRFGGSHNVIFI